MEYVYAVTTEQEFTAFRNYSDRIHTRLKDYLTFLECTYQVTDLPKCIVFASADTAIKQISSIPLPAYTNEYWTVFCPELAVWKEIYLMQPDGNHTPEIRNYYKTELNENNVLQILGHEFVHHSDLFIDEAYDAAQWFEEGMCEYISRTYFLTEEEFRKEAQINRDLVALHENRHGCHALEDFSADTYSRSYENIFYFYWKSFLAVKEIIDNFGGDIMAVFRKYHCWYEQKSSLSLSAWFSI